MASLVHNEFSRQIALILNRELTSVIERFMGPTLGPHWDDRATKSMSQTLCFSARMITVKGLRDMVWPSPLFFTWCIFIDDIYVMETFDTTVIPPTYSEITTWSSNAVLRNPETVIIISTYLERNLEANKIIHGHISGTAIKNRLFSNWLSSCPPVHA